MKRKNNIEIKKHDLTICVAACLSSVFHYFQVKDLNSAVREICSADKHRTSILGMLTAAEKFGFIVSDVKWVYVTQFEDIELPAIVHVSTEDRLEHYVVVYNVTDKHLSIDESRVII